ncbi:hypothetical protein [Actinomadura sp. NPDC000600]|uniref:hypothetical protein n=1 Tax=Actinomadura sp. NPDC000600 TaxID=3154262 RepID=UPI0033938F85
MEIPAFGMKKITRLGLTTVAAIGLGVGVAALRTNKPMKLREGPSVTCDPIGWTSMPKSQKLWVRCKFVNDARNTWYYVRPEPPAGEYWDPGWIYSGNVTNVPSGIPTC